jgi:hypothetical protein
VCGFLVWSAVASSTTVTKATKPLRSWGVTATYTSEIRVKHTQDAGDSTTEDTHVTVTVIQTPDGTTTGQASYSFTDVTTFFHCGQLSGTSTTTETSAAGAASRPEGHFAVEVKGGRYRVASSPSVSLKTTETRTDTAPAGGSNCDAIDKSTPPSEKTRTIGVTLPMEGFYKPGAMSFGGKAESDEAASLPCPARGYECSASTTVTWRVVRQKKLKILDVKLFDRDPLYAARTQNEIKAKIVPKEFRPLEYLSASQHPYEMPGAGGQPATVIYGTATVDGFSQDSLKKIVLKIDGGGGDTAEARLAAGEAHNLVGSFGDGPREVKDPVLMFVLPAAEAAKLDDGQIEDRRLRLAVEAVSELGDEAEKSAGTVEQLVRYDLDNRYGPSGTPSTSRTDRDLVYGGDDWVTPATRNDLTWITEHAKIDFFWGDMSNMNGGRFAPHLSHNDGRNVDGYFNRYDDPENCRDVVVGKKKKKKKTVKECDQVVTVYGIGVLTQLLNTPVGKDIQSIFVTYPSPCETVCATVRVYSKPLADGRLLRDVIRRWPGHETHFHIRFKR